jgi:hypothetical protein
MKPFQNIKAVESHVTSETCTYYSCAMVSTAFFEDLLLIRVPSLLASSETLSLKGDLPQATVCLGNVPLVALKISRSAVVIADERDRLEICLGP